MLDLQIVDTPSDEIHNLWVTPIFWHLCWVLSHIPEGHSNFWILHGCKKISGSLKSIEPRHSCYSRHTPSHSRHFSRKITGRPHQESHQGKSHTEPWLSGFSLPLGSLVFFPISSHFQIFLLLAILLDMNGISLWFWCVFPWCLKMLTISLFFFIFLNYLFTLFLAALIFVVSHGFSSCSKQGILFLRARASHWGGFSCREHGPLSTGLP